MRNQWVKVLMKEGKPYFVKIKSPTFIQSIQWVAECLEEHGIPSSNIDRYLVVTGPGSTPKNRIYYYEQPKGIPFGLRKCEACGRIVPKGNVCIYCKNIFNKELIELNGNGST